MENTVRDFVLLWAVVDPIGTVPVFIAVTQRHPEVGRRKIAVQAILVATGILLFFIVAGQFLLEAMEIPLTAFQVSGGVILFLFALTMILGESKPEGEVELTRRGIDTAISPLAVPSIAHPGAIMAVVLMTDNRLSWSDQAATALVLLVVLGITLLLMLAAPRLHRLIGDAGASIVSRVMGLILGAIAANNVLEGIRDYFA